MYRRAERAPLAACATLLAAIVVPARAATLPASAAAPAPASLRVVAVAPGFEGREPGDRRWLIYLDGPIDAGATGRVARLILAERIASGVVYLNSPGGSLITAMQLGRVLREHGLDTEVGARGVDVTRATSGTCYSACPFVLAGGVRRQVIAGSVIGVHRARNRQPVHDEAGFQQVVEGQVDAYLAEMGVDRRLAEAMAAVPHEQVRELTADEALRLNLLTATR